MVPCVRCGSTAIIKNGIDDGRQRYRCKDCRRVWIDPSQHKRGKGGQPRIYANAAERQRAYRRRKKANSRRFDVWMS
jgi:transposase-like protein